MIIAKNGHVVVEKYIAEQFGSWASFRPQYMIGSGNPSLHSIQLFSLLFLDEATTISNSPIAGIVRNRPVPIPGNGMQLTNIAHVRDLSRMLSLAVEKPGAALGKIFNCVRPRRDAEWHGQAVRGGRGRR